MSIYSTMLIRNISDAEFKKKRRPLYVWRKWGGEGGRTYIHYRHSRTLFPCRLTHTPSWVCMLAPHSLRASHSGKSILAKMKMALAPSKKPIPTTTIVAGIPFNPKPNGPSQFGGNPKPTLGRAPLQAPNNPAMTGLDPTMGEGCLMFAATTELSMHCSQSPKEVWRASVQKQVASAAAALQACICWIGEEQLLWHWVTASTPEGKSITDMNGTWVRPSREIVKSATTDKAPAKKNGTKYLIAFDLKSVFVRKW